MEFQSLPCSPREAEQVSETTRDDTDAQHLNSEYFQTLREPQPDGEHACHLLWHTCHLCNVVTSQLSAWLSLEALQRASHTNGYAAPNLYGPVMLAQASMLADMCANLEIARNSLIGSSAHTEFFRVASYRSLLGAAGRLPASFREFCP